MNNYPRPLPRDGGNFPMQEYPTAIVALARYGSNNAAVSSVVTLNDNTTVVEVTAASGPVAIKWVASTDTTASVIGSGGTANFDHVISNGQTRRFVVPIETFVKQSSVVGLNKQNGLYNRIAWIAPGPIASVFSSEF